jgi:hypothetical protein
MKKGWLIGCGLASVLGIGLCAGLVAVVFFGVLGIFAFTEPVVTASSEFLELLGQGKFAEAYARTGGTLSGKLDEASFTAAVKYVGLTDYASVSWHSRQRVNQEGSVEGMMVTRSGKPPQRVELKLQEQAGKWQVIGARCNNLDLADIPTQAELRRMATAALLDFNQAVKAKDFSSFYDKIADVWKQQTSAPKLQEKFQEFIDKGIDIGPIKNVEPQLDPAAPADEVGVLLVKGYYPTQPAQVQFTLKYVREAAAWKLLSIGVTVGPKQ